ncbi:hypothetical protein Nepgr_017934 [Nepenthes gracilis]|uniref:Nuclear pore complex protein NUP1-like n=1 Tax=Nepenthes gracilis TaxID=150966 RepID=A0AAD3XSZ2_NEPGR|nr:hypothetical protein Nepgr_017934 [Nepenthes gracilis]
METAGDSAGTAAYEGSGGAGGKFRKKPFRRHQRTPYDRPTTALRNPQRSGWISRIVEPASNLITVGAHKLFSSVFRKRLLPPPPSSPDGTEEPRDRQPEAASTEDPSGSHERIVNDGNNWNIQPEGNGVTKLEHILKQMTFSRSEIDRLTELLLSRTIDKPIGAAKERSESKLVDPSPSCARCSEVANGPIQESGIEPRVLPGAISSRTVGSKVIEEDLSSPAELAKAYMGSRPTKVSPSILGLQSRALRVDAPVSNAPFHLRSPSMALDSKPVSVASYENGFLTPRSRGRSAIYCMPRTPYSMVHPTLAPKGTGTAIDAGPSSSSLPESEVENYQYNEPKKSVLKPRSSILDNDIGTMGPIRRIRQKHNVITSKNLRLSASGVPRIMQGTEPRVAEGTLPSPVHSPHGHSFSKQEADKGNKSTLIMKSAHNSPKSIGIGQRILQHLDEENPKGKCAERNKNLAAGKSPAEITPALVYGQAGRSLETVESLRFLQDNNRTSRSLDNRDSTPKTADKDGGEGSAKGSMILFNNLIPENSVAAGLIKRASPLSNRVTSTTKLADELPQKRQGFQMSVQEDYLELDDDLHHNGAASASLSEGRGNLEIPVTNGLTSDIPDNPHLYEVVSVSKSPAFVNPKPSANSVTYKDKEQELVSDGSSLAEKSIVFNSSVSPALSPPQSMSAQSVEVAPQIASESNEVVPSKQLSTAAPAFGLLLNSSDKPSPNLFSPHFSFDSSGPRESKSEGLSSSAAAVASAAETVPKVPGPDKGDNKSTQGAVDVFRKEENTTSSFMTGAAGSSFSFQMPADTPSSGTLSSGPETASAFPIVLFSSSATNKGLSNGFTWSTSSSTIASTVMGATAASDDINGASTLVAASSNSLLSTAAAPSFSAVSMFKFGSNVPPSTSDTSVLGSSGTEPTDSGAKPKETGFGTQSNSHFGLASSATANLSNGIFGFNASTSANGSSHSQMTPDSGTGLVFGVQASPASAAVTTLTQSVPSQFAVSAATPTFGLSGAPTFTSGSSLFGSSVPPSNPFHANSSFGSSSLGSTSMISSMSSSIGTSGALSSTWQPSKSPVFSSTFSSASSPTVFAFGASSGSSASSSAPMVFSSTGPSPSPSFSFNSVAPPAASATVSPSQPSFGNSNPMFSFGSAPSGNSNDQMNMEDSMAEDSVQASPPAVPVFGQLPISPLPSTGFVFGAGAPSVGNPFQFGSQPNQQVTSQNPSSPFQPSSSLEFNGGSSFSLGTGGTNKQDRRIIRVKNKYRKMNNRP